MRYSFQLEKVADIYDEAMPLVEAHWNEIAHYKDIPLEPDKDMYFKLEEVGVVRAFTARDELGVLVGYAVFFVKSNMHYKSSVQATQDILYINKKHRGFGRKFIDWCDEQLRKEDIEVVYQHTKKDHNFGPMLETLNYQLVDLIYARRL